MSDSTPRLLLPELVQMQELNSATLNETLVQLDALTDVYLKGQFVTTPPASPADGDMYLLGAAPTGVWSGYAYKLAYCLDGGWRFFTPFDGLRAVLATNGSFIFYHGGTWNSFAPPATSVAFPATQVPSSDPNTLDDYEEGTWTPTDASGAGLALTGNGRYVKIGLLVFVGVDLNIPSNSSGATMAISGLPFTATNVIADNLDGLSVVATNAGRNDLFAIGRNGTQINPRTNTNDTVANSAYSSKFLTLSGFYAATT